MKHGECLMTFIDTFGVKKYGIYIYGISPEENYNSTKM